MGFSLENKEEFMLWIKYRFFKEGISPREFRKCRMKDIVDILDIGNAVDAKTVREQKINEAMQKMR